MKSLQIWTYFRAVRILDILISNCSWPFCYLLYSPVFFVSFPNTTQNWVTYWNKILKKKTRQKLTTPTNKQISYNLTLHFNSTPRVLRKSKWEFFILFCWAGLVCHYNWLQFLQNFPKVYRLSRTFFTVIFWKRISISLYDLSYDIF